MANYNKVILIGNLVRDPEIKHTPSGVAVCEFSIAVNRNWKSQDGEQRSEATFVDVKAWKRLAEVIQEHFKIGMPILVEGRLEQNRWETPEGHKRSKIKVVLERFQFLTYRNQNDNEGQPDEQEF